MSPDITMCWGKGCPVRENCYRYKAKPSEWQSYFTDDFPCKKAMLERLGNYLYFWDMQDKESK